MNGAAVADPDSAWMRRALALAERAIGLSDPNPRVGCVIGRADGTLLGEGCTQAAGEAHAEVMALRAARAAGHDLRGTTAYVTLEPCSHHGRTPPCCDALIEAGVSRVVVAVEDPNPLVAGRGIARLRAAGISVTLGACAEASRELNIGFFSRMQRGRPWVRLKIAASLDGRTALPNGASQWITGEAARRDGHAWRKRAGALLTGIGTVLEDDPRLDVRLVETARQPLRVIVDSRLETPAAARIVQLPGPVLIYCATEQAPGRAELEAAGVTVAFMREAGRDKVDLERMLGDLARREINELHVEAGHKLNGSFVRGGLVDELLIYLAPRLLGPGREMAVLEPMGQLQDSPWFAWHEASGVGEDLRLRARRRPAAS
jgi:diaminohydroxyphosphoribosylaminopyrimidine deaminase/5-amino-6-(5-phosphoribosylamino)uracil reductase